MNSLVFVLNDRREYEYLLSRFVGAADGFGPIKDSLGRISYAIIIENPRQDAVDYYLNVYHDNEEALHFGKYKIGYFINDNILDGFVCNCGDTEIPMIENYNEIWLHWKKFYI